MLAKGTAAFIAPHLLLLPTVFILDKRYLSGNCFFKSNGFQYLSTTFEINVMWRYLVPNQRQNCATKMVERKLTSDPAGVNPQVPDGLMGPYIPVSYDDIDIFNDILGDEIDSAFSSTICCCDFCYDDFKQHWPEVAFREMDFQTQSMETRWFLEHSRMNDIYSPAEMSTLRHFVACLRCGRYDSWNLWLYEHLFSDADEIEEAVDELLLIGSKTPFLMLDHPFARRVHEQIIEMVGSAARRSVVESLYRARLAADVERLGQDPAKLFTYAPPPAVYVGEGRFNHAGSPMLYAASAPAVAAAELGRPGDICHVAELLISSELLVLDLVDLDEEAAGFELMKALACSALLLAPNNGEGWLKRQYVFSRFVADCAKSAGFDAIRYGSTKHVKGCNIVVLEPPDDFANFAKLISHQDIMGTEADRRY